MSKPTWPVLSCIIAFAAAHAAAPRLVAADGPDAFDPLRVHRVVIELSPGALAQLRADPREYATGTVRLNDQLFPEVAVRAKGGGGSFRDIDDRPALTLSFNKQVEGRKWAGLRRIHLNNSVQDPTYLSEYLASELFRAAGVPAARVTFAQLHLNQRDLGLYVLKEAFTDDFLKQWFRKTSGNLYEGDSGHDVDDPLERDQGKGPDNRSDLQALAAAAREPDPARRWHRLQQTLDVDQFLAYTAVSILLADWDGYALKRNNYRVYFDTESGQAHFFPHGLDQLLQRAALPLYPEFKGLVARRLLELPEGRQAYNAQLRRAFTDVFQWDRINPRLAQAAAALRPVQPGIDTQIDDMRQRLHARRRWLEQQPELRSASKP